MSVNKISEAYSKLNYRKPAKQRTITAASLGISIKGADVGERRGKTAVQKMSDGLRLHKEQIEARNKEMEKANAEAHDKAMKNLKNNTKNNTKTNTKGSGK